MYVQPQMHNYKYLAILEEIARITSNNLTYKL